jgi:hypothetical protein
MSKAHAVTALVASVLFGCAALTACAELRRCPETVEEAESGTFGEGTFVGIGRVIRYVPSPQLEYRGYEVHIVRTLVGGTPFMDTAFVVTDAEIPGVSGGQPVLMVAEESDSASLFFPGPCVPLVVIPESSLDE